MELLHVQSKGHAVTECAAGRSDNHIRGSSWSGCRWSRLRWVSATTAAAAAS